MQSPVVFDTQGALARVEGDRALLAELIQIFSEEYISQLGALEAAVHSQDAQSIQAVAHSLKSSLGNVGAMKAAETARELEFAGKTRRLSEATVLLAAIKSDVENFRVAYQCSGLV